MTKLEIKTGFAIGNEIAYSEGFPLKERPLSKKQWISLGSMVKVLDEPVTDMNLFNADKKDAILEYKNKIVMLIIAESLK